ncbi:LacI family DNA-binding transcriptional regulator [Bifidobacterium sp. ESL0769]|uniref:LacI family DNA-binding transcriptional regulator n=1 Tax=unclassified Bifidobacterium TaxID=2608897 RepID=UPI0023F87DFF|nr:MULTISPECIES: LacI family DNA-binding transcriptional regulator [unclassified Bifidobacterium]WEV46520.1 LacI family DNA-binding transcriptional regulator [Bifidobacterium sp. ESL0690]WEV67191.1 LacI family DNA-binding transcriptional regulator [Bifidobacterium sp. ESL0769]
MLGRVTMHDVALEAGVSDSTVSRALRGLDRVDDSTRLKVQEASKRLHFQFSRNASSLASGKTMRVSLLLADSLNTWFDSSVLEGAYEILSPAGYDVVPVVAGTAQRLNKFFDRLPSDGNVDGIMVCSINLNTGQSDILKRLSIPSVGLDSRTIDGFDASVLLDDGQAMSDAIDLLRNMGHENIAFVGWPAPGDLQLSSQLRAEMFMKAALSQGFDKNQVHNLVLGEANDYRSKDDALEVAVAQLLALRPRPTAICVETDDFAVPLIGRLKRFGVRVPEDMSVIGFDDNELAPIVGLTTIRQNPVKMARLAGRKMLALMNGEKLEQRHSLIRPVLMMRDTAFAVK